GGLRIDWCQPGPERFRLGLIRWTHDPCGIAKRCTVTQHLRPRSPGQIRKAGRRILIEEGIEPIAENAGVADKDLVDGLAGHALDRIAPEALDFTDNGH